MMTIEEIEAACEPSQMLNFPRHEIEAPELTLKRVFYPLGFPTEVWSNSEEILTLCEERWGAFEKRFDTKTISVDVHVVESDSTECPPMPVYRMMRPMVVSVADMNNYIVYDLTQSRTHISISRAAERNKLYLQYFFLDGMATFQIGARYTKGIHAACVALDGRGVLLCGDSGAGKSTLSYACARAGWTYVTDDLSHVVNGGRPRMVVGNCFQVRFRPTAVKLFAELEGLGLTPRAAGQPSIEIPTASMPRLICSQEVRVDFMVFLNRRGGGPSELVPYRRDVARNFIRQGELYLSEESLAMHNSAIEELLTVKVMELRYTDLNWAVERLRTLVQEGR
jgi:hypothetical protein